MLRILKERLHQGHRTLNYPLVEPSLPPLFMGRPHIQGGNCGVCNICTAVCPTKALTLSADTGDTGGGGDMHDDSGRAHGPTLDMGLCLFCGACRDICPRKNITFTKDHRLASLTREGLLIRPSPLPLQTRADADCAPTLTDVDCASTIAEADCASTCTDAGCAPTVPNADCTTANTHSTPPCAPRTPRIRADEVFPELAKLYAHSLRLRQVSAGGCNACEADCNVLTTLVFDLGRFGIDFVASPRHADGIAVTGPVSENMRQALLDTYEAVPDPRIVMAIGTCAISGGIFCGQSEVHNGVTGVLPAEDIHLYVPGCPPNPWTILDGMLLLLGREK